MWMGVMCWRSVIVLWGLVYGGVLGFFKGLTI